MILKMLVICRDILHRFTLLAKVFLKYNIELLFYEYNSWDNQRYRILMFLVDLVVQLCEQFPRILRENCGPIKHQSEIQTWRYEYVLIVFGYLENYKGITTMIQKYLWYAYAESYRAKREKSAWCMVE